MRLPGIASVVVALAVAILVPSAARADGIDDFNAGWAGRALRAQRHIDLDTPIGDTSMVGAHNSFNSEAYSSGIRYLDPNQLELERGARRRDRSVVATTSPR